MAEWSDEDDEVEDEEAEEAEEAGDKENEENEDFAFKTKDETKEMKEVNKRKLNKIDRVVHENRDVAFTSEYYSNGQQIEKTALFRAINGKFKCPSCDNNQSALYTYTLNCEKCGIPLKQGIDTILSA